MSATPPRQDIERVAHGTADVLALDHIYPYRPGDPVPEGTEALCGHLNDRRHPSAPLSHPRMCGRCLERFYRRLHGEEAY